MRWYKTGTISVTNGSKVVTGAGTGIDFDKNVIPGEALIGPDGVHYEIDAIVSPTEMRLIENYAGPTQTGQGYKVLPVQGYMKELAYNAALLIDTYNEAPLAAQAAQAAAELARDQAQTSETNAATSATNASTSAGTATSQAGAAATSATNASTSATLAQDWATKTASEVVAGQGFGAKKYANDASASATAAAGSATSASTSAGTATTKAGEASTSASNAATSATNAANSASAAATSATNASNSASAAASSATSASTSADTATTKAGEASASATAAANSATSASTSAGTATTKAGEASTSATLAQDWATKTASEVVTGQGFGAKKYANDAAASASAAATSASNASTSASTATTQATNASNSASAAAGSATTANTKAGEAATSATNAANSATAAATSATNAANSATTASGHATTATTKAGEASTSATNAATSEGNAATSAANAATSATKAGQWAEANSGVEVEAGKYSAKHWANVAMANAGAVTSVAGKTGAVTLVKADVGLGNVDNTSDANKPVSTATQTALNAKEGTIAAGTVDQYWRGDKSWANFDAEVQAYLNGSVLIGALRTERVAMAANNIDLSAGNVFTKTISGATTLTVSNVPVAGEVGSFILDLTNGGSATVTWWSGMKWGSGAAPPLTAAGRDVLGFITHDGGTTWTGMLLTKDAK